MKKTTFILSLGSNLGDRKSNLQHGIDELDQHRYIEVVMVSQIYETEPVGYTDQPLFYNIAVQCKTSLSAGEVFAFCKNVEKLVGRKEREQGMERELDIDIIFFGDSIINEENLTVPHPRMHERAFVLVCVNEIVPKFVHPVLKKTVKQLLKKCTDSSVVELADENWVDDFDDTPDEIDILYPLPAAMAIKAILTNDEKPVDPKILELIDLFEIHGQKKSMTNEELSKFMHLLEHLKNVAKDFGIDTNIDFDSEDYMEYIETQLKLKEFQEFMELHKDKEELNEEEQKQFAELLDYFDEFEGFDEDEDDFDEDEDDFDDDDLYNFDDIDDEDLDEEEREKLRELAGFMKKSGDFGSLSEEERERFAELIEYFGGIENLLGDEDDDDDAMEGDEFFEDYDEFEVDDDDDDEEEDDLDENTNLRDLARQLITPDDIESLSKEEKKRYYEQLEDIESDDFDIMDYFDADDFDVDDDDDDEDMEDDPYAKSTQIAKILKAQSEKGALEESQPIKLTDYLKDTGNK